MANVLDNLAADMYRAADQVAREQVGFIPSVLINTGSQGAAMGQKVRSHFTRSVTATSMTASMTIPEGTDQTVDTKYLEISKAYGVAIPYTGEDIRLLNGGAGFETVYGDQLLQAMRSIVNLIEIDLATTAYQNASRAVGAAGTTPFASNLDVVADAVQVLFDNGMPTKDGRLSLVMNSMAQTKLQKLAQLQKVNESGDTNLLRRGVLIDILGCMLKASANVQAHTKGTMTLADVNNGAGEAVGQTTITFDGGTTGATGFKAGDVITFAGDSDNKYVINTGLNAASGDIVIGSPGLRVAAADATEITVGNSYTANVLLHQSAVELAIRPPAVPMNGDAAVDAMQVVDPLSGLAFDVSLYKGFKKAMIYVSAAWGFKAWKPDGIVVVMG